MTYLIKEKRRKVFQIRVEWRCFICIFHEASNCVFIAVSGLYVLIFDFVRQARYADGSLTKINSLGVIRWAYSVPFSM